MDYNERKLAVLLIMENLGEATAVEVWNSLEDDASIYTISMSLLRLHLQGLLNRYGYPKTYKITERGLKRIAWLQEEDEEEEEVEEEA